MYFFLLCVQTSFIPLGSLAPELIIKSTITVVLNRQAYFKKWIYKLLSICSIAIECDTHFSCYDYSKNEGQASRRNN